MTYKTFARGGSAAALALALAFTASPAVAGEITGNGKSLKNPDGTLNGNSLCAFSGQNDTPNGLVITLPNGVQITVDPGGDIQSFGYFKSHTDGFIGDPSDPATRSSFGFPAVGCNPVK